jgi:hypothetical protein
VIERLLENLNPEDAMYDQHTARRIMAGHVSNLYRGLIDAPTCAIQLRKLGGLAQDGADVELAAMCEQFAGLLDQGDRPTLVLPELGLQVAPDPAHEVSYGPGGGGVVAEANAAELNKEALEAAAPATDPAPQLSPTSVVESDSGPAPAPAVGEPTP